MKRKTANILVWKLNFPKLWNLAKWLLKKTLRFLIVDRKLAPKMSWQEPCFFNIKLLETFNETFRLYCHDSINKYALTIYMYLYFWEQLSHGAFILVQPCHIKTKEVVFVAFWTSKRRTTADDSVGGTSC